MNICARRFGNGCLQETIGSAAVLKVDTSDCSKKDYGSRGADVSWMSGKEMSGQNSLHWALSPLLCSLCTPHLPHLLHEVVKGLRLTRLNKSSCPIRLRKQLLKCAHVTGKLEHFENFEHSA